MKADGWRRFHFSVPFNVNILMVVMLVLIPLSATLCAVGWYAVNKLQNTNIRLNIARVQENVTLLLVERVKAIGALERQLATRPELASSPSGDEADSIARWRILNAFIDPFPSLTAAYAGYKDGGFAQASVLARASPQRQREIDAPPGASRALWLISFSTGVRKEKWVFFDDAGNIIATRAVKDGAYDPRVRLWYEAAVELHRQTMTDPYPFAQRGGIGITAAAPLPHEKGVIGADFSLTSLSTVLREYKVSPSAQMNVMTDIGDLLADSNLDPTDSTAPTLPTGNAPQLHAMVRAMWDLRDKVGGGDSKALKIEGETYLVLARALPPAIDKNLFLTIAIPENELAVESDALLKRTAILALIAIAAAIVIVGFVSRVLTRALERLALQTQRFRRLDFSDSTIVRSRVIEVSRLADSIDRMRSALELFGRYIPTQIVRRLMDSDDAGKIGGVRRDVTVMFTDVQGFSSISEAIEPEELMARLSEYFNRIAAAIIENRGTVDKYIGDGIMSVWNAPDPDPDHIANACRGALAIQKASLELAEEWRLRGLLPFHTRIGLHCGVGVVGNVGSTDRMNYTLIGSIVNLAARLEGINKFYGTEILASAAVYEAERDEFNWRRIDRVVPVGTSEAHDIYELVAVRSATREGAVMTRPEIMIAAWNEAMAFYLAGNFSAARQAFDRVSAAFPDDAPSLVLAEYCKKFEREGIPPNWDGTTWLVEK